MTKNNLVTKTYFKTTLDKSFKEQDKKWDEKIDKIFNKFTKDTIKAIINLMQTEIISRLNRIDKKLDLMISRIDKHDDRFEMHERRLFDHNSRIGNLEKITAP